MLKKVSGTIFHMEVIRNSRPVNIFLAGHTQLYETSREGRFFS